MSATFVVYDGRTYNDSQLRKERPLQDLLEHDGSPSRLGRLSAARWVLVTIALVFLYFSTQWQGSAQTLLYAYLFICLVVAFAPRRRSSRIRAAYGKTRKNRSIWPETQAKLFVNAIPEPSIVLDGDGIVRHINEPMEEVFGAVTQGEPITLKFRDPDFVDALSRVQKSRTSVSLPHMVRFPAERHYLIHFSPVALPGRSDNKAKPDFIFVMMLDQTERHRVEELRSNFIANVSHELRTPVASLTGFIETLLGPAKDDDVSRERFLNIMLDQAHRMSRLVDDLLSLSRIEMRSHVRPTDKVDLSTIIANTIDALSPLAKEAGVEIIAECDSGPFWVNGDQDELLQVMQNLMENACKYGADGKKIEVSVKSSPPPADFDTGGRPCYVVTVRDYGQGIPAEHLPRLTERFYRVDAEESKRKMGTGLGLAVVKHILMRHQGYLKVASVLGEGAAFSIYFAQASMDE